MAPPDLIHGALVALLLGLPLPPAASASFAQQAPDGRRGLTATPRSDLHALFLSAKGADALDERAEKNLFAAAERALREAKRAGGNRATRDEVDRG